MMLMLLLACTVKPPQDLGRLAADQTVLSESESLAHLAAAGGAGDVANLLRSGEAVFSSAPDPSTLFADRHQAHQELPVLSESTELRVMTYNIALLSRTYLGTLVEMPELEARLPRMGEVLFTSDYDVLLLQEVWEWKDLLDLQVQGAHHGYVVYGGTASLHSEHGLAIAVRVDAIDWTVPQEQDEQQFTAQRKMEFWPGPDIKRGWLRWSFTLSGTGQRVHLYDIHATSFVSFWLQRELQARQVGSEVASRPAEDVVILGGDLNSGPYYHTDVWIDGAGQPVPEWWRNAAAYGLWLHYGEMYDVINAVREPEDVRLGSAIPTNHAEYLSEPYGQSSWCDEVAGTVYTGTDCNSLYFQSYAGTEFPARLDHILIRDPSGVVRVQSAGMAMTELMEFETGTFELSDHYAVEAILQIGN
jgi:endonuclease/exonuclease/phosphatase family metal-dependent hydrolase